MGANQITPRGTTNAPLRTEWQEATERRLQSLEEVSNEILQRLRPRDRPGVEPAGGLRHVAVEPRYDSKPSEPPATPALHRAMARLDALCDLLHTRITSLSEQLAPVLGSPMPSSGAEGPGTSQGPPGNAAIVQALWLIGDRLEHFAVHAGAIQTRLEL